MLKPTKYIFLILVTAAVITVMGGVGLGKLEEQQLETWLAAAGIWAPALYVLLYTLGTLILLPSTPLNLAGGALFGSLQGTFWTTVAAVIAALVAFCCARTVGHDVVLNHLPKKWLAFNKKIEEGGFLYIFSVRLIPIIPYGIVNFLAGLTSIKTMDYFCATLFGTIIGVFPFVMLGSSIHSLSRGNLIPLTMSTAVLGVFILISTIYRQLRCP